MNSTINPQLLSLLARIEQGETGFKARSDAPEDVKDFLYQVKDLKSLQKQGHIEILDLDKSSATGRRQYVAALVSLTDKGKRFLTAKIEAQEKRENKTRENSDAR